MSECVEGLEKHVTSHDQEIKKCIFCKKPLEKIKKDDEDVEIN